MFSWLKRRERGRPVDWRDTTLFEGSSEEELAAAAAVVSRREVAAGDELVTEGEPPEALFVVAAGRAAVVKRESARDREFEIGTIESGDVVGELGVIDRLPAAATVRMKEPGVVWVLPLDALGSESLGTGYDKLVRNLGSVVSDHVRTRSEHSLALLKRRAIMGDFVVKVLVLLSVYVFLSEGLEQLRDRRPSDTYFIDLPLQISFGIAAYRFIRGTGYPLRQFGIGFRDFFGSLVEGVVFTVPFVAFVTGVKWLMQRFVEGEPGPLIAHPDLFARLDELGVVLPVLIYAFTCLVQELIVRGALQSSLESWLMGPRRRQQAIVVSALLFGVTHLHVGFVFAVSTLVPGVFWGWLFSRNRNLVGVTISHAAVGGYVFFVLGLPL